VLNGRLFRGTDCVTDNYLIVTKVRATLSISKRTYSLLTHSMVQDIIWKADCHSAYQKISSFLYGTRRFITVLTKASHWTLSWASRIQFVPSIPVPLRSILMLFFHLRQWSLTFKTPNQSPVNASPFPHACHMSRPPYPPWFNHPNRIRWRIQAVKFIIVQFSPLSVFLSFRSEYPSQHSVLRNPQSMFLPQSERPSFAPIQHNRKNYSFVYINL
jgi:hypothetical protein